MFFLLTGPLMGDPISLARFTISAVLYLTNLDRDNIGCPKSHKNLSAIIQPDNTYVVVSFSLTHKRNFTIYPPLKALKSKLLSFH